MAEGLEGLGLRVSEIRLEWGGGQVVGRDGMF